MSVTGSIDSNWYIYSHSDASDGLDGISIGSENENIKPVSEIEITRDVVNIQDAIFGAALNVYKGTIHLNQDIIITGAIPEFLNISISGFVANGSTFLPFTETIKVSLEGGVATGNSILLPTIDLLVPAAQCGEKMAEAGSSVWSIFLKGFAGGLLALLMPCIFPMLPVTVSFFMNRAKTKQQGVRNGFLYGAFIFLIYLLASLPFHIAGNVNPQIFNIISTNVWVNLAFFFVFMVFALSLYGLFELRLPGALANTASKKSDTGSIGGIFFMALTLAIVSFSCTGPILGFLLVNSISETNGAWALTSGLAC